MLIRHFDASALVKRYVKEEDSSRVARWLAAGPAYDDRLNAAARVESLAVAP